MLNTPCCCSFLVHSNFLKTLCPRKLWGRISLETYFEGWKGSWCGLKAQEFCSKRHHCGYFHQGYIAQVCPLMWTHARSHQVWEAAYKISRSPGHLVPLDQKQHLRWPLTWNWKAAQVMGAPVQWDQSPRKQCWVKQYHEAKLRLRVLVWLLGGKGNKHELLESMKKLVKWQKTQSQVPMWTWKGKGTSWPLSGGGRGSLIRSALEGW